MACIRRTAAHPQEDQGRLSAPAAQSIRRRLATVPRPTAGSRLVQATLAGASLSRQEMPRVVLDRRPLFTRMLESMIETGTVVTRHDLTLRGFVPHKLAFRTVDFSGAFCEWDTIGVVPDSAGLYAFVLRNDDRPGELRVAYVGKTRNLWMVTKGRLPRNGGARGPQRYGRWKHAGETRARVKRTCNRSQAIRLGCCSLAQRPTCGRHRAARAREGTDPALGSPHDRMEPWLIGAATS